MNIFKTEKRRIKELLEQQYKLIKPIEEEINHLLNKIKNDCVHPPEFIYEVPYKPRGSHDWDGEVSDPPYRVCSVCGIREEGWGCGYKILATNSPVTEITDVEGMKVIRNYLKI